MARGADGEGYDDDDQGIVADRIQSLSQLNLRVNGLEVDLWEPPKFKETVGAACGTGTATS